MFIELVKGVALLLARCFLHGFNIRVWRQHPWVGQVFSGLIFGGICVVGMLTPVVLMPGVIFDARSVVLSMAGLFGGPLVAGIAALMAATRLSPLTTARTSIGNLGQRLPSMKTSSGVTLSPATARCIASMVACRMLSSSISAGLARPMA